MLVNTALLEVCHHVSKPRLCSGLSSLLLNFVHLLEILLGGWVQFAVIAILILRGKWSGLRLRYLIDLEPTAHG